LCELKECTHPTVMNDMCAECGTDLRKNDVTITASVPMVHAIPDLKVSEELAQKLGKADAERLIKDRKLVLLVD
jgi:RNA polymerase II subunit A-like phosphatase